VGPNTERLHLSYQDKNQRSAADSRK
jgi:hypothetical protein